MGIVGIYKKDIWNSHSCGWKLVQKIEPEVTTKPFLFFFKRQTVEAASSMVERAIIIARKMYRENDDCLLRVSVVTDDSHIVFWSCGMPMRHPRRANIYL